MSKGQYLVYERASRDEERLFLETAKEVVNKIEEEPKNWKKHQNPKKHPGGRNVSYGFRTMLLILLLMVYHVRSQPRLSSIQDPPEESTRKDWRCVRGQGILLQGERQTGCLSWRNAFPNAKG